MKIWTTSLTKLCFLLVLIVGFTTGLATVQAEETRVFDQAQLLSAENKQQLEAQILELKKDMQMDVVVVTTNNAEGKTSAAYADDYYDKNKFGTGPEKSGILLLLDMDNREAFITTSGEMINLLNDARIERLLDAVFKELPNQNYYGATTAFLNQTKNYYQKDLEAKAKAAEKAKPKEVKPLVGKFTGGKTIASLLSALLLAGFFCLGVIGKYKMKSTTSSYNFRNNGQTYLTFQQDNLMKDKTTSRRIPKKDPPNRTNNSGGGGTTTTRTSSSGKTHGGSGRSMGSSSTPTSTRTSSSGTKHGGATI